LQHDDTRAAGSLTNGVEQVDIAGWFAYWMVCLGLATTTSAWDGVAWFLVFGLVRR